MYLRREKNRRHYLLTYPRTIVTVGAKDCDDIVHSHFYCGYVHLSDDLEMSGRRGLSLLYGPR